MLRYRRLVLGIEHVSSTVGITFSIFSLITNLPCKHHLLFPLLLGFIKCPGNRLDALLLSLDSEFLGILRLLQLLFFLLFAVFGPLLLPDVLLHLRVVHDG